MDHLAVGSHVEPERAERIRGTVHIAQIRARRYVMEDEGVGGREGRVVMRTQRGQRGMRAGGQGEGVWRPGQDEGEGRSRRYSGAQHDACERGEQRGGEVHGCVVGGWIYGLEMRSSTAT